MGAITVGAERVIEQLQASHGNISHAAGKLDTSRDTLHRYINAHPTVKVALRDIKESAKDRAETMIEQRMATSDTLLIFYLKTQAYDRGYGDQSKVEHSGTVTSIVKGYATVNPDEWDEDTTDGNL